MSTVTPEDLCKLALAAIDDTDARQVRDDAFEEAGYVHPGRDAAGGADFTCLDKEEIWSDRFIAAVLLFGEFPTRWELAERCWSPSAALTSWLPDGMTMEARMAADRALRPRR